MEFHQPVMLEECMAWLAVRPGGTYADLTLGLGGHSAEILRRCAPGGRVAGVDKDPRAAEIASERLKEFGGRFSLIRADFREAADRLRLSGFGELDGFLMDLGVSTMQLKTAERGFSFSQDAPLDMRMDTSSGETAAELLAELSEDELTKIMYEYGEERWARAIARKMVLVRSAGGINTTRQLAELVAGTIPRRAWPPKVHPATRTFQALRIAVNDELGALTEALGAMLGMLKPGGRAVVMSYHSLEDRIVKETFKDWAKGCRCPKSLPVCVCGGVARLKVLTGRPVTAQESEVEANPSARSAKLRAAERI